MSVSVDLSAEKPLVELPSFTPEADGRPGEDAVQAFERDGVVCLRQAFSADWVALVAEGMEQAIHDGTPRDTAFTIGVPGEPGFFFYDTFMWKHMAGFKRYVFESPAAALARDILRSQGITFYFDFMLVKEPGTSRQTPWHYDEAYWPISGTQACNHWLAVDSIPRETGLRFVRGSHRWADHYNPVHFDPGLTYADLPDRAAPPDWAGQAGDHEIVYAPLEQGDCLIFHCRTHHSAPGNALTATRRRALSTCWFGDEIRYRDKPYETDPPYRGEGLVPGGPMACESFPRII